MNGKTGNLDNLSFLFGNMQNNPYAQQDREFMQAYQNAQNQFNAAGGIGAGNGTNYSPTGYQNVDSVPSEIRAVGSQASIIFVFQELITRQQPPPRCEKRIAIQYTPTRTFNNGNGTYTVKDYVTGNNNLKYALEQAAKNGGAGQNSTEEYAKSLYNRIGTQRADLGRCI